MMGIISVSAVYNLQKRLRWVFDKVARSNSANLTVSFMILIFLSKLCLYKTVFVISCNGRVREMFCCLL